MHEKILLRSWEKIRNKIINIKTNGKTNIKDSVKTFQTSFDDPKKEPKSKRKYFLLGAGTVFGTFGVTIFASTLPAIAKYIPKKPANPSGVVPIPPSASPSADIIKTSGIKALGTFVGGICAAAATDGSFILGAIFGLLVTSGILANRKQPFNPN